jgi:hypothetical protein
MTPDELAALVAGVIRQTVTPIVSRLVVLETQAAAPPPLAPLVVALEATVGQVRERVASLEARASVPGPAGPPGQPGTDGLGFDELSVSYDGRRTLAFTCTAADGTRTRDVGRVELAGLPLPAGRWTEGKTYTYGDLVTHDRSSWLCTAATATTPGTSSGASYWLQVAARGDRGRDAR